MDPPLPESRQDTKLSNSSSGSKKSHTSLQLPPPTATSVPVLDLQTSKFKWEEKGRLVDEHGSPNAGIQAAKIPLSVVFGRRHMKCVMPSAWRSEARVKSWRIRIPSEIRKERMRGHCKSMYISTSC